MSWPGPLKSARSVVCGSPGAPSQTSSLPVPTAVSGGQASRPRERISSSVASHAGSAVGSMRVPGGRWIASSLIGRRLALRVVGVEVAQVEVEARSASPASSP